ncbi:hypothetical protein GUJ93_ZPchr0013g36871 [Zizania palustris]|uniref:Anaphase-promoting complex subunit 4-like WD40 domain-containing protein n=1 Tax=Zizania palustris TaxID=103762 RepID=A0A8J5WR93_ZIZPA|nr:hypothetical protein GUJ93_ZPchr0013g36871 [Zizania palustris]
MNTLIVDPLQGDFPETIEEFLQYGNMKCIAFNRRGTLLAAGCANGTCVIWDFETRGVARELHDKDCTAPITSVTWSKCGHHLLASATDKSLTLWHVVMERKIARITLQQTPLSAHLHPGGSPAPSICLACPLSSAPILVDLNTGSTTVLPAFVSDNGNTPAPNSRNKFSDGSPPLHRLLQHLISGTIVKDIVFSRDGRYLLTNSNDRVIRLYKNLLPVKSSRVEIEEIGSNKNFFENHYEKLKLNGASCLDLSCEISDAIAKIPWKAPCFSGDAEWIVGASASKGEHRLCIWNRTGRLIKILEGPKEALIDLAWHPLHPTIVSVSVAGLVYIWAKEHVENWSAFAPDFVELEENEEYVEREDEFDINAFVEKTEEQLINEDGYIDIETYDKDSTFSDLDDCEVELIYLAAIPIPDTPDEQPDKCLGSSSKLEDSNHSGSPFSLDAVQNGQTIPPASSPMEVDNSTAEELTQDANSKRQRRLSAKGLELKQTEKGKKPTMKNKTNGKSPGSNGKQVEPANGNSSAVDDEATEDDYI